MTARPHDHPLWGSPSAAQLDPKRLPAGDSWTYGCPRCYLPTQGGRGGLAAHLATVHGGESAPTTRFTLD
ncbi:hypothetical protein KV557_24665 [Kitasatospora aureofaciens]|uniref:hypothetical protein n=1 Tax=Kitasatospora aureofaciens TaxID=1894 RepID=UPI001C4754FD|nr:hypothetical protein [Kitasatospora aureofaciens]MBV6700258.1 hypothetical protein [Kitasatospora aureofaciens]